MGDDLNYAGIMAAGQTLVPDIAKEVLQQQSMRLQNQQAQFQLDAAQQAQVDEDAFHRDAIDFWERDRTPQGLARLMSRYPQHADAMKKGWDTTDADARTHRLTALGSILHNANRGDWDGAHRIADTYFRSEQEAGVLDDNEREIYRIIQNGSPEERAGVSGLILAQMSTTVPADRLGTFWKDSHEEQRQQELQPYRLSEARSRSQVREAEAGNADDYYDARADRQRAGATIAGSNARFADQRNQANVDGARARASNLWSTITARAKSLGKRVQDVTEDDLSGGGARPSPSPRARRSAQPITATDGKGNRLKYNPSTAKWEPVR